MYKKKRTGIIGIIITVIILIIVVFLTNLESNKTSQIENIFGSIIMPVQNGLTYLKNKIAKNDSFFTDINNLKDENQELKDHNAELEQSLRELESIKAENSILKEQLNLTEKYGEYKTVPGYVINKDISNYSNVMVINIGEKDGIKVNMTVISDKGLVGHIISTTENTAKVQTIIDTANTVSCTISTSRDGIIARGTLNNDRILKATYIPTDASLVKNDSIETSGLGGIYPKGIHVGTIKEIYNTQNVIDRYVEIETAVDFAKLETVLVITN